MTPTERSLWTPCTVEVVGAVGVVALTRISSHPMHRQNWVRIFLCHLLRGACKEVVNASVDKLISIHLNACAHLGQHHGPQLVEVEGNARSQGLGLQHNEPRVVSWRPRLRQVCPAVVYEHNGTRREVMHRQYEFFGFPGILGVGLSSQVVHKGLLDPVCLVIDLLVVLLEAGSYPSFQQRALACCTDVLDGSHKLLLFRRSRISGCTWRMHRQARHCPDASHRCCLRHHSLRYQHHALLQLMLLRPDSVNIVVKAPVQQAATQCRVVKHAAEVVHLV
mmetsp:Transcript_64406/g.119773  ORF Transcript_64406/g.119773 Transcript_64406/m.119773 type:complete len:278 (+) Transcript_64406:501-1334(+)